MIANKIIDQYHIVEKNNKYIVDTNVLLELYGPDGGDSRLARIMVQALNIGCDVYVPSVVVEEFIRVFRKKELAKYKNKHKNKGSKFDFKKHYQNTNKYNEDTKYILGILEKNIFSRCKQINDDFDKYSYEEIVAVGNNQTYNDNVIIKIANINDLYVLSHDYDTKKIKIK